MRPPNAMVKQGQKSISQDVDGPYVGGPLRAGVWLCSMKASPEALSASLLQHPI